MSFIDDLAHDLQLSNTHATVEQFKTFLQRCRIWQYEWGAIMALDNDMHIHVFTHYRKKVFLRRPLREVAFFMFNQYETITTSIMKTKPDALAFDLRMGWKLDHEDESKWHLTMTKEDFKYVQ